ncbi:hypothetical protein LOTGIDRAFT_165440 [Lottia gigantea]|uniref:SCAN box domain-containing protein n=1 Tax=Lottia gigantea TaxID=225164 RepID=V4A138_LOTGI|nr:hypothetical protein LOTGIDRAFT_165440 [Lottia gigantea]ESO88655.1 hypothetical protein LOTGIDRAFT_165440 [Lottia gigantea]
MDIERLLKLGKELGLEGETLKQFVDEETAHEREEKVREREERVREREDKLLERQSRMDELTAKEGIVSKEIELENLRHDFDGFRNMFRNAKPETGEFSGPFFVRLESYLDRWIELSDSEQTFDSLKDLLLHEQYMQSCPKDLALFLKEHKPINVKELAELADRYIQVHGNQYVRARNTTYGKSNSYGSNEYTGDYQKCILIDGSVKSVPVARLEVNTPYFQGKVTALCMENPVCDVIIGNIANARNPFDPDLNWNVTFDKEGCDESTIETGNYVETRAQIKSKNKVFKGINVPRAIDSVRAHDIQLGQDNDKSLGKVSEKASSGEEKVNESSDDEDAYYEPIPQVIVEQRGYDDDYNAEHKDKETGIEPEQVPEDTTLDNPVEEVLDLPVVPESPTTSVSDDGIRRSSRNRQPPARLTYDMDGNTSE